MPAVQRGQAYKLGKGRWGLRYYDVAGVRRRKSPFPSKSAALDHFRDVIEPELRGEPAPMPELTLAGLVGLYLDRHAAEVSERTVETLRERLAHATKAFGDVPLRDLERMSGELAGWKARQSDRSRYGRVQALRQTLEAAGRWGYMGCNPAKLAGKNPEPPPRSIRIYSLDELEAIAVELSARYRQLPVFAAATGLRPEEWGAAERGDVDRREAVLTVRRTISSGRVVELAKTDRSHRQVPLSPRALAALEQLPARIETRLLFPAPAGGVINLDNFRRREWSPAIDAGGIRRPARPYDMRSTYASNAIAAGIATFELARVMGTSSRMIEKHYGTLLDGAGAGIAARLGAFEAAQERDREQADGV